MPLLKINEFSRISPLLLRILPFEEVKNFKKKINNSQMLIFKIYDNKLNIYTILNTKLNITVNKEFLDFFIKNRRNFLSYLVFETNFFFEIVARIQINSSLSNWEQFQQTPILNDYDLICYLIVYRNKILRNVTLTNFKKIKDLQVIHDLFKNYKQLDVFFFFGTSNNINLNGRVSSIPELNKIIFIRFFVELFKLEGNFYQYYLKKIKVSQFLFFSRITFFFLELIDVEYKLDSDRRFDENIVVFESNFYFEAVLYLARGVYKEAVRDQLLSGVFFDKYLLHSIIYIDPDTKKMRIVEQFEYHKFCLDSTNFLLLLNKISIYDNLYLTLMKKEIF